MAEPIYTEGPNEQPTTYNKKAQWVFLAMIVIVVVGLLLQSIINLMDDDQPKVLRSTARPAPVPKNGSSDEFVKLAEQRESRLAKNYTPDTLNGRRPSTQTQPILQQWSETDEEPDPYKEVYEEFQREEIRRNLEARRGGLRARSDARDVQRRFDDRPQTSVRSDPMFSGHSRSRQATTDVLSGMSTEGLSPDRQAAADRLAEVSQLRDQILGELDALKANPAGLTASNAGLRPHPGVPLTANQITGQATVGEPVKNRPTEARTPKPGEVLLPTGTVMSGVLDMELISDYDGPWRGLLVRDTYDVDQKYILFPKGTRVVGDTIRITNVNEPIQARMGLVAKWAILPNGNRVDFTFSATLDSAGVNAVKDKVSYHVLPQLAGVTAYALLGVLPSLTLNSGAEAFSSRDQALSDLTTRSRDQFRGIANKYLNLVPTVTLRSGTPFKLFIEDDLYITPWRRVNETIYTRVTHPTVTRK